VRGIAEVLVVGDAVVRRRACVYAVRWTGRWLRWVVLVCVSMSAVCAAAAVTVRAWSARWMWQRWLSVRRGVEDMVADSQGRLEDRDEADAMRE
jgi:hypothetical protein